MKPSRVLLIINPVSGKTKSKTALFDILDELYREDAPTPKASEGIMALPFANSTAQSLGGEPCHARRVTVIPTMYRGHATELASHAAKESYDTVICCGGDGTLNETMSGLLAIPPEARPTLGYIPCGSTNDFAVSMGLSATIREAARVAVGDHEMRIDTGRFSPSDGEKNSHRFFSYIASFGVFTAASYSTPQAYKNVFGHAAYILQGIKDLGNIQPRHARVELPDGTVAEGDYVFGAVTNTTSVAGLVRLPTEQYSMSDGEFEVFLVHHPRTVAELNKIITALMTSDLKNNPLIDFYHASSVRFTLEEPIAWALDGEEAIGGPVVDITCLPKAIRIKTDML